MKTADAEILIVPGFGDSGPEHWQSRWENKLSTARRVMQPDWHRPIRETWVTNLIGAVAEARKPVVLIAHSLGAITVVHAAAALAGSNIAGAFLVAASDPQREGFPAEIDRAFAALPMAPLPFRTLQVASRTDPYARYERAETFASAWGSELVDAGDSGHINVASGHGPWPDGLLRFAGFLRGL
jgi:uncharacterized protein